MSWTTEFLETNFFKVKNTDEVLSVLRKMGFETYQENDTIMFYTDGETYFDEETEVILCKKPIQIEDTKTNFLGLISCNDIDSVDIQEVKETYNLKDEDIVVVSILDYLQDQLQDDKQYIAMTDVGFTGRTGGNSNPFGEVMMITKNMVMFKSLYSIIQEKLTELNIQSWQN